MPIIHKQGDLFTTTATIIAHQVNCQGKMSSGVALQVKKKYPSAYTEYLQKCQNDNTLLGQIQIITQSDGHIVCNMFAQDNYGYDGKQYTDTEALQCCFIKLKQYAAEKNISVAIPYKIGCCRGGANWDDEVYPVIENLFSDESVSLEIWRLDNG